MPVSEYFHGKGRKVMASMKTRYGEEKGKRVFYATANSMKAKSHLPRGASQSPKGDLAEHSDKEYFVQRHFKESGHILDSQEAFGSGVSEPGKIGNCDGHGSY